jgi:hypothetical protein
VRGLSDDNEPSCSVEFRFLSHAVKDIIPIFLLLLLLSAKCGKCLKTVDHVRHLHGMLYRVSSTEHRYQATGIA